MIDLLIVDDELEIREGIKCGIAWNKYDINICGSVGSAFEALEIIDCAVPDIVMLDIKMSQMDGLELLGVINQKYPGIKTILISGYDDFSYAQQAVSLNAFSYLLKPLDGEKLLSTVLKAKDMIEKRLEKIKKDEELNRKIKENISALRDTFFLSLLKGKLPDLEAVRKRTEFLDVNIEAEHYAVVIFDMEELENSTNKSLYDKNLLKAAVIRSVESSGRKFYKCYTFNIEEGIGLIICDNRADGTVLKDICRKIREFANNSLGISLTVGIGNVQDNLSGISLSFKQAMDALKYKIVLGRNEIIDYDSISVNNGKNIMFQDFVDFLNSNHDMLIHALKTGEREKVENIAKQIVDNFQQLASSNINSTNRLMFILSFFLSRLVISLEIENDTFFDGSTWNYDIYTYLRDLKSIDKLTDYIIAFLDRIMDEVEKSNKTRNSHLVQRALKYINENINNNISLTNVADYLYIHPNYFSKIFRQEIGETFIDYIIRVKMEEAKRLLKNSNYKVYEIAQLLEYKDISHFIKVFKKMYGVSPAKYKELL